MDYLPQHHDYANVEPFYDEVAPDPIYENDRAEVFFDATMHQVLPPLRRSERVRIPNSRLADFVLEKPVSNYAMLSFFY
jgi:hypothetical protein